MIFCGVAKRSPITASSRVRTRSSRNNLTRPHATTTRSCTNSKARRRHDSESTKFECRNSKRYKIGLVDVSGIAAFRFRTCFVFRISSFEFARRFLMLLGKVIGTLTPCVVYKGLEGVPMLWIQPLDKHGDAKGEPLV